MKTLVLVVGLNPSKQSPDNSAFHPSTKSRKTLDGWLEGIDGAEFYYINISDSKEHIRCNTNELHNKINELSPHKIIGLGRKVQSILTMLDVSHLRIPHPSGLNRSINDPETIVKIKADIRSWINS